MHIIGSAKPASALEGLGYAQQGKIAKKMQKSSIPVA
jgi:hypothetical protein